jgi:polysaccharide deacetylase family protein (PEP-CTERM system associated)
MNSIFSVDVEDWFHILDLDTAPQLSDWESLPSRVEKNFLSLLERFDAHNVKVTCFFLGWVAERFPGLVREACERGHEIASHGYAHRLVYEMGRADFVEDARKARHLLEDISGQQVSGYRSAGFSVTADTPWFFEALTDAGYRYDSSIFPAARGHGGMNTGKYSPYVVTHETGEIVEFPITVADLLGRKLCFFGGGYLRLFPYWLIRRMAARVRDEGRPVIYYIHPREIDPDQPRVPMNAKRRFKSYVNLKTTERKVDRILAEQDLATFRQFIEDEAGAIEVM